MSELSVWKVGVPYPAGPFKVFGSDGTTLQTGRAGSFTTRLVFQGVDQPTAGVVYTEAPAASGIYYATFTPTARGKWSVFPADPTNNTAGWQDDVNAVTYEQDDLQTPRSSSGCPQVDVEEWRDFANPGAATPNPLIFGRVDASEQDVGSNVATAIASAVALNGSAAPTVAQIAAGILVTPGNLIKTDATGHVGINWGDITNPATAQNLSATTIATSQAVASVTGNVGGDVAGKVLGGGASALVAVGVQADVEQWKTAVPVSLTAGGRVGANVQEWSGGAVNALSGGNVQADVEQWRTAVPNALIAGRVDANDNAVFPSIIRANTCQAGSGTTTLVLDAGASATTDFYRYCLVVLTGGTGAGQKAWVTGYNGATKTATTTCVEGGGFWLVTPDVTTTFAMLADTVKSVDLQTWLRSAPAALSSQNVQVDVETWRNSAPNALVSGRVDASVGAVANAAIGAAAFAANALGSVWDELESAHTTASTFGKVLGGIVLSAAGNVKADLEEWRATVPNALTAGRVDALVGAVTASAIGAAAFAANALGAVWDETTAAHVTAGTMGKAEGNLDATVSSRATQAQILGGAVVPIVTDGVGNVGVNSLTSGATNSVADALLDRAAAVDGATPRQIWRGLASMLWGRASGGPDGSIFRDITNAKNRFTFTTDASGNRTAVTADLT